MSDRHYLLKVMGLSAIPRFVTFGLTMISFPLMVRALGASQFGVVVFIGAITSVMESFVDFGVSSAAGKGVAAARETQTVSLYFVIRRWARLQATIALIGLVPLMAATYIIASVGSNIAFSFLVLITLGLTTWITISLNFVRACLTSLLAFKSLAALDAFESIFRSASWLFVAYRMPTTMGLALASITTASCASVVAACLLLRFINGYRTERAVANNELPSTHVTLSTSNMLKESLNFLWLRLGTRVFSSIPTIAFGRMFGSELVGIIGAFAKIVELINFPFAVIGNALAVRAVGVVAKGNLAARSLWDLVSRLIAVAVMFSITIYLGGAVIARALLPNVSGAAVAMSILSVTVVTSATSSVIAPMSDYVGALRSRNLLVTSCAFVQVPAIWIGARTFGATGAIVAYVLMLLLMNGGYVRIALSKFFPATKYHLRSEVSYFLTITAVVMLLTLGLHWALGLDQFLPPFDVRFVDIAVFWSSVVIALVLHQPAKQFFLTRIFFDFQTQNS